MKLQIFNPSKKSVSNHQHGTIRFEWWRVLVAGLTFTTMALLLATYIVSGTSEETDVYQDEIITREISVLHSGTTSNETNLVNISHRILPMAQVYCAIQSCVVTCSLIPAASSPGIVAAVFIDSDYKSHCPDKVLVEELIFKDCKFSSNALSSNWFPSEYQLKKLTLKSCSLMVIDSNAFSTESFGSLISLSIIDEEISVLEKSLFDSLIYLEELVISNNPIVQAEADLLAGTANAMQIIQIDNAIYSESVLVNISGKNQLPKVLLLSLTGNQIATISGDAFKGVPNVQSVYLTNSGISSVEVGALEPFSGSIRQLFISDNKLSSLPIELFQSVLKVNSNFRLALANNEWNCECEMEWMKNLTSPKLQIVTDEPRCVTPERNSMIKLSEADFCGNENTSEIESVETTTSSYVTTTKDDLITLMCIADEENSVTSGRKLLSTLEMKFRVKFPDFSVKEEEDGSVWVSLGTTTSAFTLIWFSNDLENQGSEDAGVSCMTNVKNSVNLNQLRPGVSYTICLLDMTRHLTTPFNCLSLRTQPDYNERLWLANKDKMMIISVTIVALIIVCVMSVIGSYYVVRENPKLLKGSKRIIMVRHLAADAIVLPKGVTVDGGRLAKTGVSISRSSSNKSYVSAINQRKLLARKGSVASGTSSRSSGNSYVSGIEPTSVELIAWRFQRIKDIIVSCNNSTKNDDSPPPLPPPRHRSIPSLSLNLEERRTSNISMSIFTTTSNGSPDLTRRRENNDQMICL